MSNDGDAADAGDAAETTSEEKDPKAKSLDTMKEAMDAQQVALSAQSRAMQASTDAYLAEQESQKRAAAAKQVQSESRRTFLKAGGAALVGAAVGVVIGAGESSAMTIPKADSSLSSLKNQYNSVVASANSQILSLQGQVQKLQTDLATTEGFLTMNTTEQAVIEAIGETIIPSDSSGPGFKEAGAIFFIDRQLTGDYGKNGNMYMEGPFVPPNTKAPVTVDGITYSAGTPPAADLNTGYGYQYPMDVRTFWRLSVDALNDYSQAAYNNTFDQLSSSQRVSALTDLFDNKPTTFGNIRPSDFAFEVFMMSWAGFLMDPLYGGNKGMVGWEYTAFSGVNNGNSFGEGHTYVDLMVSNTPVRLKPLSLAQFQAANGYLPQTGGQ